MTGGTVCIWSGVAHPSLLGPLCLSPHIMNATLSGGAQQKTEGSGSVGQLYSSKTKAGMNLSQLRWSSIWFSVAPLDHRIVWPWWRSNKKAKPMRIKDWSHDMSLCGCEWFGVPRSILESDKKIWPLSLEKCLSLYAQFLPTISGEVAPPQGSMTVLG